MLSASRHMRVAALLLVACACAARANANAPLPVDGRLFPVDVQAEQPLVEERAAFDDTVSYRLPNNTRPLAYAVHLTTNVHTQEDFNFTGTVAIRLEAREATRFITLHHRQLTINSASLATVDATPVAVALRAESSYVEANNQLTFTLADAATSLVAGTQYTLTIAFNGTMRGDEAGFYRSSYLTDAGQRRWLATTQFESTDARHAFPCYDEPALRAKFAIKITHGKEYTAISNMPAAAAPVVSGDLATTTFNETPDTPSYLIAFIVSDFASIQAANAKGFVQRVFARSNAIQDGDFGLQTGIKVLDAFEKYLEIPFTLPKMDQVAVPDFAAGAMENWGLVTYREVYLLWSEARSTFINKRNVATIIAHEYAHQWFGNLVTPKWWTYIWLNEGFATLFENYATEWVFPEWKILEAFVPTTLQNVMISDATNRTRPMTHYVDHQTAVSQLFDNVAYPKSGSVLRMFLHAFTEESFRKALVTYLNAKSHSDAVEEDLFAHIEKQVKADATLDASLDVATIMGSWTRQAGFPLLTVTRDYSAVAAGSPATITVAQKRYFGEAQTTVTPATWWVPINFATAQSSNFSATAATNWLSTAQANLSVAALAPADWLLLNKLQSGFYRVQYDAKNYELLSAALLANHSAIHLVSRAQLLDDAFELARSGVHSYAVPLTLAKFLKDETEYVPWASAWRALATIERLQSGSAKFADYKKLVAKLITKLFAEVGVAAPAGATEEHHYRKQARNQAIQMACEYGHEACLTATAGLFGGFLNGTVTAIHQDVRGAVLCNGARSATDAQVQRLMQLLQAERDQDQRNRLIDALTCSETPKHLSDLLLTSTGSEQQWTSRTERYRVFAMVAARRTGVLPAIEFLQANLDDVRQQYGDANLNSAFDRVAEQVNSAERKQKFEALLVNARQKAFVLPATLVRVEQTVRNNDAWIAANQKVIEEWVEKNGAATYAVSALLMVAMLFVSQLF